MADNQANGTAPPQPKGFSNLINHVNTHKIEVGLWTTRVLTIILAVFGYFLPLGITGDPIR